MLTWLVDNVHVPLLLLGAAALVLLGGWWLNRQRKYLIALGVVAGLGLLLWLLALWVPTDRKQIKKNLQEMAEGLKDPNLEGTFKHISADFHVKGQSGTLNKEQPRARAKQAVKTYGVRELVIWDVTIVKLEPPDATVDFFVKDKDYALEFRCVAEFVREKDGQWRMKTFKLLKPLGDAEQIQLPF